jgi:hypothetical protein
MVKHDLWIEREISFPLVISPSPLALPDRFESSRPKSQPHPRIAIQPKKTNSMWASGVIPKQKLQKRVCDKLYNGINRGKSVQFLLFPSTKTTVSMLVEGTERIGVDLTIACSQLIAQHLGRIDKNHRNTSRLLHCFHRNLLVPIACRMRVKHCMSL